MDHETQLILSFFLQGKRERYLSLLSSQKGRGKLHSKLPHLSDLDSTLIRKIKPSNQNMLYIINQLKEHHAPDVCYVIAEDSSYDQRNMTLEDAFTHLFGCGIGYFISCIPGRLAYYEGEDINERYLLLKTV